MNDHETQEIEEIERKTPVEVRQGDRHKTNLLFGGVDSQHQVSAHHGPIAPAGTGHRVEGGYRSI
jgi:hypothetical protein